MVIQMHKNKARFLSADREPAPKEKKAAATATAAVVRSADLRIPGVPAECNVERAARGTGSNIRRVLEAKRHARCTWKEGSGRETGRSDCDRASGCIWCVIGSFANRVSVRRKAKQD